MARPSRVSRVLARNRLGVPAVVFFIVSAAAPLTVIGGAAALAFANTRAIGLPVAYAAIAVVLGLFSVGYVAMSRHITNAGAFYTYVAQGLGRVPGVGASFVAVIAYNAMQIGLYGGFGGILAGHLATWFGWNVPWWVLALLAWVLVGVLGVLRVDFNSRVLAVLLTAECLVMVIFNAVELGHPAGGEIRFDALDPANLFTAGAGALLVTAVTGFVGFEGGAVYAEETRDPRRTVAHATYTAVALVGVLYALSAWALTVYTGPDQIVAEATEHQDKLLFTINAQYLGETFVDIGRVLIVTSLFAALLSFHNTVARYLFALGRERVLPPALGETHRRTGSPYVGSLTQTALALVVIIGFAVLGLDPLNDLLFITTTYGGLGVLILMTVTAVAVTGYFSRRRNTEENAWRMFVAPGIAAALLAVVLVLTLVQYSTLMGLPAGHPLVVILPASFGVAALAGTGWGLYLRNARPDVYATIGLGANSVIGRASREPLAIESAAEVAARPVLPPAGPGLGTSPVRHQILRIGRDHPAGPVADVLSRAFLPGEVAQWLVPDVADRERIYPLYWRMVAEHALVNGAGDVYAVAGLAGVTVWFPATQGPPDTEPPDFSARLAAVCGRYTARFAALHKAMADAHPRQPHHYLAFAAVRPDQQGRGLGTAVITHRLLELDTAGMPAYLEATNRRNLALYVHLGFQPTGKPITLPDGPKLYPMWRSPSVHRGL